MGHLAENLPPAPTSEPDGERRFLLRNVSWDLYLLLRETFDDTAILMTYREGELELMSPGRTHETWKTTMARLLETWATVRGVTLYGYGSETHRHEAAKRGLEAAESYFLSDREGFPDLALEVVVTSPLIDKLDIYRTLGVREVWVFSKAGLAIHTLIDGTYQTVRTSQLLPDLELDLMLELVRKHDQVEAVRRWYEHLIKA